MRIARAMAVKIVFNRTQIACVNLGTVMYDRVVASTAHVNARRVQWGPIRFPFGVTAVKTSEAVILAGLEGSAWRIRWAAGHLPSLRKFEVGIFAKIHRYQKVQARADTSA